MRTKRAQPEAKIQQAVFEWIGWHVGKYPILNFAFHSPNGGSRNLVEAKLLKASGVKPGVPDLLLPIPCGEYQGLAIEFKAGKNQTTDFQKFWLDGLEKAGYLTGVVYSVDEGIELVKRFVTHSSNSISPDPFTPNGKGGNMENEYEVNDEAVVIKIFYPESDSPVVEEDDIVFLENTRITRYLLQHLGLYQVSCLEVLGRKTWYALRGAYAVRLHETIGKVWFAESVTAEEVMGQFAGIHTGVQS